MNGLSKKPLLTPRYFVILFLITIVSTPTVIMSQEETATTTPDFSLATTTLPIATTTPSTATTTDKFLPPASVPEEETATTTGEVLGESTASETEENEEEDTEELIQPIIEIRTLPPTRLLMREFKRQVIPDARAFHSCEAEVFRIDVTGKTSARARIMLQRDSDAPYEIEIGGLPLGIDITFSKNNLYRYTQGTNDGTLELAITNQYGSQKGNFSIPIIYTKKDTKDSSVICQINIINQ